MEMPRPTGRLYAGCSGFSYTEWKPEFYPPDTKSREFLRVYASRLDTVEINNTFYRMPRAELLHGWREQVPEGFRFALKVPQRITHIRRLRDVDESVDEFLRVARELGDRLGPILFQLPPSMRYDRSVLEPFLMSLPGGDAFRFAMEFRHPSWEEDEPRALLREHGVAWCVADTDQRDADVIRTAPGHVYMRLRKITYDDEALATWAKRIGEVLADGADVYCYFKHEDEPTAPRYALRTKELLG